MKSPNRIDGLGSIRAHVEAKYRNRTPASKRLFDEAVKFLPGGDTRAAAFFSPYPFVIDKGEGCSVVDVDGNVYLDFVNNYTALIHGHAHPRIVEAVSSQLRKGTAFGSPVESQTGLAKALCERVPSLEKLRFCNSGTEATMNAMRLAKAYTGRPKILKMEGGYHGSHDAAEVSLWSQEGPPDAPHSVAGTLGMFEGVVEDVVVAPFNNSGATRSIIERHADKLAGVIVEPVMGAAGMLPPAAGYLDLLREATQTCGALLIFDEVITLRLAWGGAQESYRVAPDLTTLGKVIGGGFPVGVFGGRDELMSPYDPREGKFFHSGTFNGNPVTMVAGLAALELLTRQEIARINSLGERLRLGLRSALADTGLMGQVTGIGSLLQIHFSETEVTDYRAGKLAALEPLQLLHLMLLNRGVSIAPRGLMCISTPMDEQDIDHTVSAFRDALGELASA